MKHDPNISHHEGKRPASFERCNCPCCGSVGLDLDDMATAGQFPVDLLTALAKQHGAPVCFGCANGATLCAACDEPVMNHDHQAMSGPDTLHFCDSGCMGAWIDADDRPLNLGRNGR